MYGNRLFEIMEEKEITYRQLSRLSGISVGSLYKIANHISDPKQSTMIEISRALKMPVENIFDLNWKR